MEEAKPSLSPVTLRPLTGADLDAISAIHVEACRVAYRFMDWDHSLAEVREWYSGKVAEWDWTRVAEQHARVAGYIAMKGTHIDQFFVDPLHQGQGLGSALFAAALDRGLRPLTLDVFEANLPARRFYEKRGFREAARWFNEQDQAVQLGYVLA